MGVKLPWNRTNAATEGYKSPKKYIRMAVMKDMPGGGSTTVDIPSWNPVTGELHSTLEDMHDTYVEACQILDERHIEMNMRIIETSGLRTYFTQEEWSKVISLFDILAGRQSAEQVRNRWEAIREENRELAEMRQAALEAQQEESLRELAQEYAATFGSEEKDAL
jgi:plasmid stabilization system protein ParE